MLVIQFSCNYFFEQNIMGHGMKFRPTSGDSPFPFILLHPFIMGNYIFLWHILSIKRIAFLSPPPKADLLFSDISFCVVYKIMGSKFHDLKKI